MRKRTLFPISVIIVAAILAAGAAGLLTGCAKRQLTRSEMTRLDAIAAMIDEAERLGAKECDPRELARAQAELEHARHEMVEHWERAEPDVAAAEKAAEEALAKAKACAEARKPKPAPTVSLSASPASVAPGQCATLAWSSTNATDVSIDQGIGAVGTSGKKEVCPSASTEYTATATGPGGTATVMAKVDVMPPPEPPAQPEAAAPPPEKAEEQAMFENIHFDFDRSFIRPDAKPILEKVAAYLKKNPGRKILIAGNCDERGTSEYNMALGERRADAAKKYLVNLGIEASRVSTISYGKERPIDPGHTEEAWAKNRNNQFTLQ